MKIASIVITYNRKELLVNNIKSQLLQKRIPDYIFIIDNNSTDNTYEYIKEYLTDSRFKYFNTLNNLGGAGGFNYGLTKAFSMPDVDAVLLMDDDGKMVNEDTLSILESYVISNSLSCYCLNSLVTNDNNELSFSLGKEYNNYTVDEIINKYEVIDKIINPFNGTLVSRELFNKIGNVNKDFFIKGDEVDYMLRALNANAVVATITSSLYYHPSTKVNKKTIFGSIENNLEAPWKEYYAIRNLIYVNRDSFLKRKKLYLTRYLKTFILKTENPSLIRKFLKKGYKDGVKGCLGKTILPGQTKL